MFGFGAVEEGVESCLERWDDVDGFFEWADTEGRLESARILGFVEADAWRAREEGGRVGCLRVRTQERGQI